MRIIKDSAQGVVDVSKIGLTPPASAVTRMQSAFDPRISHEQRRVLVDSHQLSVAAELRVRREG
jgi:hypothetical protein